MPCAYALQGAKPSALRVFLIQKVHFLFQGRPSPPARIKPVLNLRNNMTPKTVPRAQVLQDNQRNASQEHTHSYGMLLKQNQVTFGFL